MAEIEELTATNPTEYDDDAISLTSTQYGPEDDADQEYFVEDILAEERDHVDGDPIYLVQWTGYPLEKCTWEPKENIGDEMLEHLWETKRRKPDFQPFDYRLLADAVRGKTERHFRRNRVRQRRNLPLTEPIDPLDAWLGPPIPVALEDSSPEAPPSDAADKRSESNDVEMADAEAAAIYIADDGKDTLNPSDDDVVVLGAQPKPKKKKKKNTSQTKDVATPISASVVVDERKSTKAPKSVKISAAGANGAPKSTTEKNAAKATSNKPPAERKTSLPSSNQPATTTKAGSPAPDSQKKTFSARKSGLAYGAKSKAANVFTGGKKRTRTVKSEPSTNKKKPDFYFTNLHMRHKAEVRGRQKEDREIDSKEVKLYPITGGQPIVPVASDTGRRASATSEGGEARAQGGGGPSDSTSAPPPPAIKAKKKSVRFSVVEDSGPSCGATPSVGNATVLDEDVVFQEPEQLPLATQSVVKTLALGEQGRNVEARLTGVPLSDDGRNPVLRAFMGEKLLLFGYSCLAATFQAKFGDIRQHILFSGGIAESVALASAVEKDNARTLLDTAAERLRATASCLVFARQTYFVVLYPVRSDDWKDDPFGSPLPDDASDSVLRYLAFSTPSDFTPFLQPYQDTPPSWEKGTSQKIQDRARVMQAFFELDWGLYRALLPQNGRHTHAKRNFFLAFPPSAPSAMQQMAFWLRSVDPKCVLFLSVNAGAWMAFQEKVVAESEVGVVLVHEVATWTIRRFPGLTDLLLTDPKDCKLWSVSQSMLVPPLFPSPRLQPSTIARFNDTVHRPGRFRLTRLFPRGLAVLLTPSFLVSEPQRTFVLLKWFYHRRLSHTEGVTLVTAANICEYLRDVADEKARLRDEFLLQSKHSNATALKRGIDAASCQDHYNSWLLATEICASPQTKDWCVFHADDAIDGNDEQSLVNWFGWFSTVHMDRFRSFYVVGSKGAIKTTESGRGRCQIRMPHFTPGTVANPDDIRVRASARNEVEAVRDPKPAAVTNKQTAPSPPTYIYTTDFCDYLKRFYRSDQVWKIYAFPVLWKDDDEAFRLGCLDSAYATIAKWFAYTWPFRRIHRVYIGLFYTIDEDVQSSLSWNRRPRHPWIVVYRQVNPYKHYLASSECELILWDPRAESRFRGLPHVRQADLTESQRAVIDYVSANGTKKNEDMPLKGVYIGGSYGGATAPVDEFEITMQQLIALGQDCTNVLPPRVTECGYRRVYMADEKIPESGERPAGQRTNGDGSGPRNGTGGGSVASVGDSRSTSTEPGSGAPAKIVFHPPAGDAGVAAATAQAPRAGEKKRSRCNNELFRRARRVLDEMPDATSFLYEFRPTMDWYSEQVEEGRGFGHVHVNSWEAFFNAFRIEAGGDEMDTGEPMDMDTDSD